MKKKKLWVRLLAALLAVAVLLTGLMIWKNKKTKAAAAARAQSLNTAAEEKGLDITPQFQEFDGYPALAQALATKQIDCFSVDGAILLGYVNDSNHLMDERFAQQDYGVAAAKENTELAELVDAKIKSMLSDGTMDTLKAQWGLE